jgi:hypothetical protein
MTAYGNLSPGVTALKSKSLALKSTKIDRLLREQNRVLELLRHWIAQALMEQRHALLPHIAPRLSAPRLSFRESWLSWPNPHLN